MNKIIFCNVIWSKDYREIKDYDPPNEDQFTNFLPFNHFCYGHFDDKYKKISKLVGNEKMIQDVTVVWTAINKAGNRKIVGWYEHADVFGDMQTFFYESKTLSKWFYYFRTREENVYCVPSNIRRFDIPTKGGNNEGIDESNFWYSDSNYFIYEFLPKVLQYMGRNRDSCKLEQVTSEDINKDIQNELSSDESIDDLTVKFISGENFRKNLFYDEAIEFYKQYMLDFSKLDDDEKTEELEEQNLQCMYDMASIYMSFKDYSQAGLLLQNYYEQIDDDYEKCKSLFCLMYIHYEENDYKQLGEVIDKYDKLDEDIREDFDKKVKKYREYVIVNRRNEMFPKTFNFKGVKFTRIDDGYVIDKNHKFEFDKTTKSYFPAVERLYKKIIASPNLKLAQLIHWSESETVPDGHYKESWKVSLPNSVTKFPYELDATVISAVLTNKLTHHSIYTELLLVTSGFNQRHEETGSFHSNPDNRCFEYYIVDYTNANDDVIKHNGVIKYTDKDIE